jgi:hypothetical protein
MIDWYCVFLEGNELHMVYKKDNARNFGVLLRARYDG